MPVVLSALTVLLILTGLFFFVAGTVGLLRFPDVYTRIHAATKCDTLGAGLILLALLLTWSHGITSVKELLIVGFLWLTNPVAAHLIGRAAYHAESARGGPGAKPAKPAEPAGTGAGDGHG